jgi:hypothetical protein
MKVKRRAVAGPTISSEFHYTSSETPWLILPDSVDYRNKICYLQHQEVQDEGNDVRLLGRTHEDIGGPFINRKIDIFFDPVRNHLGPSYSDNDGYNTSYAEGVLVPYHGYINSMLQWEAPTSAQMADYCPSALSDNDLDEYGATAIARVAPTNPLADAASTIGELRAAGGIPKVPGTQGNVGSEYLNYNFGIAPTIDEIKAYYESWQNAEKLLEQLERDSGRLVRRKYQFPELRDSTTEVVNIMPGFTTGALPTAYNMGWHPLHVKTVTTTRTWFSGAFTYHLPEAGTWRRKLAELDYLYGVKPGVDTLWELMPWSWLIDYQSNAGDVIKNLNAFSADGLIMPYAYIMSETKVEKSFAQNIHWLDKNVWQYQDIYAEVTTVTQQRRPATPFGFGFQWGDLQPRQIAILAALGISRV